MTIELPCTAGDIVFADLRVSPKKKPKIKDLTECRISTVEIDAMWKDPLFTAIRSSFDVCHPGDEDFGKFWLSDFGKTIFTKEQYFAIREG